MPGRGQANIGIWPKSSEYSRCLGITWNAEVTIGTFCSDLVVRECLHSLFTTTLFFPFFRRKHNNYQNGAFSFCGHVINKWHWLVHKNPALRNLHQWCKYCAAARNENANMDCSGNASLRHNVRFASATHASALHAHDKPWLLWKTRKGQRARTCVTSHAVTKSACP